MKNKHFPNCPIFDIAGLICAVFVYGACQSRPNNNSRPYSMFKTPVVVPLSNVKGAFDLMAIDVKGQRLFVSAQDNHSVEVIDIAHRKRLTSILNLNEPKWIVYRPEKKALYVATGADGKVTELDDSSFAVLRTFSFREKCNNLRFDEATSQLWVGVGNHFGALGIIDTKKDSVIGEIPLSDYPKQFEIDDHRIYVNIPAKHIIDIVDRHDKKVVANWFVNEPSQNIPMALDIQNHRLFIACDSGKLIIYSTQTGKPVDSVAISHEPDGIYYDQKRKNLYISSGEGFIDIVKQLDADRYEYVEKIVTVKGAATCLYSQALDLLTLPIPQRGKDEAAVRFYKPFE